LYRVLSGSHRNGWKKTGREDKDGVIFEGRWTKVFFVDYDTRFQQKMLPNNCAAGTEIRHCTINAFSL
jgi:hypothetical protein